MISPSQAGYLRHTDFNRLIIDHAYECQASFSPKGTPVVIAAHNEEHDLPATLIALAASKELLQPIVVENGSTDDTAEIAKFMGAKVASLSDASKVAALQAGVDIALDDFGKREVLFTDADTLVGPSWCSAMLKKSLPTAAESVTVCGASIVTHGESTLVDCLRTLNSFVKDKARLINRAQPVARGHNMAIDFGANDDLRDLYSTIRPDLFVGEERAICDITEQVGGQVRRALGLKALVVTRGDRFSTLRECLRVRKFEGNRLELYDATGPMPFTRYDGSNAFL